MNALSLVAAVILGLAPVTISPSWRPPVAPHHAVSMRLVPVTTQPSLADSLVFRLEFVNRDSIPVGLWIPPPYHPGGWDLLLRIRRPDASERMLRQEITYQRMYIFNLIDLVVLKPNERVNVWLSFNAYFSSQHAPEKDYAGWQVFTPAEYSKSQREHSYRVEPDVMGKCFDRPGPYQVEAILNLVGAGGRIWITEASWPRGLAMCEASLGAVTSIRIHPRTR